MNLVEKLMAVDKGEFDKIQMDYLHYRFKNWKPFEYMSLPEGQKRIARAYMRQEMEDKDELNEQILKMLGGAS